MKIKDILDNFKIKPSMEEFFQAIMLGNWRYCTEGDNFILINNRDIYYFQDPEVYFTFKLALKFKEKKTLSEVN